ncbi:MAG: RagB/SusD family nutrient uptake outer membrane protein [Sphingobacteriaceae bacterium]|nr:MAG: RagB/SusD family nutrient uptake outer membrane protein [Sphingobacteriaceae bacterium]
MRKYNKQIIVLAALINLIASSCKKEYFDRVPLSQITVDNFYQTTDQINASTNLLYAAPWFGYSGKAGWSIADLSSGNGRTYSSDVINFQDFTVTGSNFEIAAAWNSLFIEVSQANAVINNLPLRAPASIDRAVVNNALGEARLWRAMAYFHLVRIFGAVPIIENSADYTNTFQQVPRNLVTDVYKFIINDLKFAETNCYKKTRAGSYSANARVSSGSASAMLAKVYLYMRDYTNARAEAEKVINSGEFKLYGIDIPGKTFADLFRTSNNNNEESIIQIQWGTTGQYGIGNPFQAAVAYNGITGTGDGYGQMAPTFDLQDAFDPADARRKPTIMLPGDYYAEINSAAGGYTLPADANSQGTHAQVKKYIVGTPADNGGLGGRQASVNNTYLMRYAEIYLIEAEAVMAGANSSSDPVALNAINIIRRRAGLGPLTVINRFYSIPNPRYTYYVAGRDTTKAKPNSNVPTSVIKDDILDERRREFAFENDFFYDLLRLDGFNVTTHPKALQYMAQQDRGTSDSSNPPIRYGNQFLKATDANLVFPIPTTEIAADPKLAEPPVPYVFK